MWVLLYVVLQNWQAEFPLDEEVIVKRNEAEYLHTIADSKGCFKTLIYTKVRRVLKLKVGVCVYNVRII